MLRIVSLLYLRISKYDSVSRLSADNTSKVGKILRSELLECI